MTISNRLIVSVVGQASSKDSETGSLKSALTRTLMRVSEHGEQECDSALTESKYTMPEGSLSAPQSGREYYLSPKGVMLYALMQNKEYMFGNIINDGDAFVCTLDKEEDYAVMRLAAVEYMSQIIEDDQEEQRHESE